MNTAIMSHIGKKLFCTYLFSTCNVFPKLNPGSRMTNALRFSGKKHYAGGEGILFSLRHYEGASLPKLESILGNKIGFKNVCKQTFPVFFPLIM